MIRYLSRPYLACLTPVNGSRPPIKFLDELVDWGMDAPEYIFWENANSEIYTSVIGELGPFDSTLYRKAAMLEVLRVPRRP